VLRLARENAWGYTRILGELKKLGVQKISRSTVIKILKDNGLEPGPRRGEGPWDELLKRHASTLWDCDFFTKKVWMMTGLVDVFILFFIQVGGRRVQLAGITANPDRAWMVQQARNVTMLFDREAVKPKYLLRDRDSKFVPEFDAILASEGIEVKPLSVRAESKCCRREICAECPAGVPGPFHRLWRGSSATHPVRISDPLPPISSPSGLGQPAAGLERMAHGGGGSTAGRSYLPGASGWFAAALPTRRIKPCDVAHQSPRPLCATSNDRTQVPSAKAQCVLPRNSKKEPVERQATFARPDRKP